jgi:hypothetical protein
MIAAAIAKIEELVAAKMPRVFARDGALPDTAWVVRDGELEFVPLASQTDHLLKNLESLGSIVSTLDHDGLSIWIEAEWTKDPVTVHVVNVNQPLSTICLEMTREPAYAAMAALEVRWPRFSQHELVRFVRHDLARIESMQALLPLFRRIDWSSQNSGTSEIIHGKETLGRAVVAAVNSIGEIPERILIDIPVIRGMPTLHRLAITIDIDVATQQIGLAPIPGDCHAAMMEAAVNLRGRLEDCCELQDRVYIGRPTFNCQGLADRADG